MDTYLVHFYAELVADLCNYALLVPSFALELGICGLIDRCILLG